MSYNFDKLLKKSDNIGCGTILFAILIALAIAFGISCLFAWAIMALWNWIIVGELGLFATEIGFWPAWGLMELCSLLFKPHNYNFDSKE